MILKTCSYQNYASHQVRGANFRKNTNVVEKHRVCSHQSIEKEAQAINNLQNCRCDTCCRFAHRALEVKNAQVTSENQNYDGRLKRKGDEPNGQKSDKCPKDGPMSPYLRPSMLQKVDV